MHTASPTWQRSWPARAGTCRPSRYFARRAATLHQILGLEHPVIASNLNNLASVIDRQKRYAEAEELHRKALAMRQKLLGPEHPDVAISLNNLASVLGYQGRAQEAEPLQRQALALYRTRLGAEHPDLAVNLDNLANLLLAQGKRETAMESLSEAARIREGQLRVTTSETRTPSPARFGTGRRRRALWPTPRSECRSKDIPARADDGAAPQRAGTGSRRNCQPNPPPQPD